MKILRQNILKAMELPVACVASRGIPITTCLLVSGAGNRLSIRGTDLEHVAECVTDCEGSIKPFCISAKSFLSAIQFGGDEIELEFNGNFLHISNGSKITLPTQEAKDFPKTDEHQFRAIGVNCQDLANGIKSVGWCYYRKDDRPVMQSVHVVGSEHNIVCEACDGVNMAYWNQPSISARFECVVPMQTYSRLADVLMHDGAVFRISEKYARVDFDGGFYQCRLLDGSYPSTKGILENAYTRIGEVKRDDWLSVLNFIHQSVSQKIEGVELGVQMHFETRKDSAWMGVTHNGFQFERNIAGKFQGSSATLNSMSFRNCMSAFDRDALMKIAVSDKAMSMQSGNLVVIMAACGPIELIK